MNVSSVTGEIFSMTSSGTVESNYCSRQSRQFKDECWGPSDLT